MLDRQQIIAEDEIQTIGEEYFKKWNLDSYSKVKIKKNQINWQN